MLSILVISYNTKEMTIACIESVFEQTRLTPFEIIVWDNASDDDSAEGIGARFHNSVRLIASNENIGFAAANNRAAKLASGNFLLLLNPDTVVLDGAIDKLVGFANARSAAGIWGGRTVFRNGALNPSSCWQRQTLWSLSCQMLGLSSVFRGSTLFNPEGLGGWDRVGVRNVDIVSGCFLLIHREIWNKLGGFSEEFFMYGEDADLCLRAQSLGVRPLITSDATIIHYGGASERIRADKLVRLLKAKSLLLERHLNPADRQFGKWLLSMWPLSRYMVHHLLSRAGSKASTEPRDAWRNVVTRKREWTN
jgi:N-acetylglucosaminyl-diphospho-decaprenol L-rhamnosyltransferase